MSESDTRLRDDVGDDPRRVVQADLLARLLAALVTRARDYDAAAAQAAGALRQALEELARVKRAQLAALGPLAQNLGVHTPSPSSAAPTESRPEWGVILGQAFQDERTVEGLARDLAGLLPDPAGRALGAGVARGASQDRATVRGLYLRYS
jgi:hypothetical protein